MSSLENLPDDDELSSESVQWQSRVSDSGPVEHPGPLEHHAQLGAGQQSASTDDVHGEEFYNFFHVKLSESIFILMSKGDVDYAGMFVLKNI